MTDKNGFKFERDRHIGSNCHLTFNFPNKNIYCINFNKNNVDKELEAPLDMLFSYQLK